MTREEWLNLAVQELRPMLDEAGLRVPATVRVSIGFGPSRKALGVCWPDDASADRHNEIFISPIIKDVAGPQGILATLLHELVHAALPPNTKHRKPFQKAAAKVGLLPPWTATSAGDDLLVRLEAVAARLGPFPGAPLTPPVKKQTTRLLKVTCAACGYVARVTARWIDAAGAPICPTDNEPMEVADA